MELKPVQHIQKRNKQNVKTEQTIDLKGLEILNCNRNAPIIEKKYSINFMRSKRFFWTHLH